jgi:3-hydroxyacyl-[acyl-carrier-protein] dehydratase
MKSLLSDDFFYIREIFHSSDPEEKLTVQLELNPAHEIYKGHFPGNPVVPGVCLIEMIKETLAHHMGKPLTLKNADEVKFMNMVNPELNPLLNLEIRIKPPTAENLRISATITAAELVFVKFRGSLKQEE